MFKHLLVPTDGAALSQDSVARACDLIFMASHGRRGVSALLPGSEANKVPAHSKIPGLVYR
jgi:nucleotide-binding universal stress UspA family protein